MPQATVQFILTFKFVWLALGAIVVTFCASFKLYHWCYLSVVLCGRKNAPVPPDSFCI